MATINEEARIPVYINDEQVKSSLKTLTAQADKWRKAMREAMASGDLKGVKAAEGELKKVNRQVQEIKRTSFDVNKVLNNLSSASAKDLRKALSAVNKEMQGLKRNSKEYNELARKSKMLSGEIQSINAQTKALTSNVSASGKAMGMFGSLLPIASVSTLIFGLGRLGGELFDLSKRMEADNIRSNQVFGESLGYVSKEAEALSRKMGMTNREFIAAATATGDLLIPLDFTREQAAEMSVELQSLSGALDEWTGGEIGAAGVSEILTKAMLGENEQLKQLGIAIRKDSDEYRDLVKQKEAAGNVTKAQAEAMATLVGDTTRFDNDFVPYEIKYETEQCQLPIICCYVKEDKRITGDIPSRLTNLLPKILLDKINNQEARTIHIPFREKIILQALNEIDYQNPPMYYMSFYKDSVYNRLGIE